LTAENGGQSNDEDKPRLLSVAEMIVRLCQSSFVFAQHEATHEHCTKHDDETKEIKH
jgi:hypothetical protein